MLALIIQLMYKKKRDCLSTHHKSFPLHHQQQHQFCEKHYRALSWLQHGALSNWFVDFATSAEETRLASVTNSSSVLGVSHSLCIQTCCKVFFIVIVMMALCCDAKEYNTSSRAGLMQDFQSLTNEAEGSPPDSFNAAPYNFTNLKAFTNFTASTFNPETSSEQRLPDHVVAHHKKDGSCPQESATRADLVKVLVSTLEKLNVLRRSGSSCFRLEKIVQNIIETSSSSPSSSASGNTDSATLGVYLYFREVHSPSDSTSGMPQSQVITNTSTNSSAASVLKNSCFGDPEIHWNSVSHPVSSSDIYRSNVVEITNNSTASIDMTGMLHAGKLSRTQIVVIATCSSIIGMFFLVAAFLRIRNYVKRARIEQEMAKRPKFRSCSVALRGATQSMEQLRRDSLASKISHQNSEMTRGSNGSHTIASSRENSATSSPRHDPDNAPLLVLTKAPPTSSSNIPADLTYIDEEDGFPKKKVAALTSVDNSDCQLGLRGQSNSEIAPMESCMSQNGGCKTQYLNINLTNSFAPNEQQLAIQREEYVNPSFSVGSISSYAFSGSETQAPNTPKEVSSNLSAMQNCPGNVSCILLSKTEADKSYLVDKKCVSEPKYSGVQRHLSRESNSDKVIDVKIPKDHILEVCNAERLISSREEFPGNLMLTSLSSQAQNTPDKASEQTKGSEICTRNIDCEINTDAGDSKPFLLDISSFGLSQSDTSLSSPTNQGNEFFGQTEYKHPDEKYGICVSCTSDNSMTNSTCDTEMEIENSNDNNQAIIIQKNTNTAHTKSPSSNPCLEEDVRQTKKNMPDSLNKSDVQMLVNQVKDSSRSVEQSHCGKGIQQKLFFENIALTHSTTNFTWTDKLNFTQTETSNSALTKTSNSAQTETPNSTQTETLNSGQTETSNSTQIETSNSAQTETSTSIQTEISNFTQTEMSTSTQTETSFSTQAETSNATLAQTNSTQTETTNNLSSEAQPSSVLVSSRLVLLDDDKSHSFPCAVNNESLTNKCVFPVNKSSNCIAPSGHLLDPSSPGLVPKSDLISWQQDPKTTDMTNQGLPGKENMISSTEPSLPNEDSVHNVTSVKQSHVSHDPNNLSNLLILPQQSNDISSLDVQETSHGNKTLSLDIQGSSMNNNDPCLQLLPVQAHSQFMNSSTC